MKFHSVFQSYLNCSNSEDVFRELKNTLTDSISIWNYFVDWDKVISNYKKVELSLNILNYLIGKDDVEKEFNSLLRQYPVVVNAIPILIACRTSNFKILTDYINGDFQYKVFDLKQKDSLTDEEISSIVEFTYQTGVLNLFKNRTIKSVTDYVIGIEVGLDSNARKNRGGSIMETIVESQLRQICEAYSLQLMKQATPLKISSEWGIQLQVDKASRRFDFAVKSRSFLYLIETNFYAGGGSKLKATAGEYKTLFELIKSQGHNFVWITDGLGWKTALRPLEETFNYIDYTLNLQMISTGLLSEIITRNL